MKTFRKTVFAESLSYITDRLLNALLESGLQTKISTSGKLSAFN